MRLKYLLLSLCLVGFAQPAAGARIYWRNGVTTSAEQQVVCVNVGVRGDSRP
jgi:hypothetical protein